MKRTSGPQNQTGAAVVEFAVLLFVVLILLAGIFEFGFLWLQNNYIANAAREGSRVAAKIDSDPGDVQDAIMAYLNGIGIYEVDGTNCCNDGDFVAIAYDPDEVTSVDADGTPVYTREVTVTVQTAMVWDPLLWNLININPLRDPGAAPQGDITVIAETAVFPKEDQTPPVP